MRRQSGSLTTVARLEASILVQKYNCQQFYLRILDEQALSNMDTGTKTFNLLVTIAVLIMITQNAALSSPIFGSRGLFKPSHSSISMLRDPMPWEDGFFDPTYHAWPKSRQEQVADKKSVKLTGAQSADSIKSRK